MKGNDVDNKRWKDTWLKVAEAFGSNPRSRGKKTLRMTMWGLCPAFAFVLSGYKSDRGGELKYPMEMLGYFRGDCFEDNPGSDYWFPNAGDDGTREYDDLRCLFACLFSNMTVKEFEEVCQ